MNDNEELVQLIKKLLILELFKLGVPQKDIGLKLKISITAVNQFLKGASIINNK